MWRRRPILFRLWTSWLPENHNLLIRPSSVRKSLTVYGLIEVFYFLVLAFLAAALTTATVARTFSALRAAANVVKPVSSPIAKINLEVKL